MKKLFLAFLALGVAASASAQKLEWSTVPMDGSRTGVTAPNADNVKEALGTVKGSRYIAPNGRIYRKGSARKVAKLMIDSQEDMAFVKEVVGFAPQAMVKRKPECELSNWSADILKAAVEKEFGRPVDIALTNFGGIRVDMPQGDVLLDDILSMFPFNNYLTYVAIHGRDVRRLFEIIAGKGMEAVSGVEVTIQGRKLVDLKVGGQPVDDDKIYGLATIDYLLNGGDDIFAKNNAEEVLISDKIVYDGIIEHVREIKAQGKFIEAKVDGRVKVLPQ